MLENQSTPRYRGHKTYLALLVAASSGVLAIASQAVAQDEPSEEETDDMIVVTGSRIAIDSATSAPSPVQVLDGEDIATSGQTDITQLLRETPSLQGSLPATFSAFQGADTEDPSLGMGLLNLRGLGIERTLVLQDGRRHVPGTAGQSAVDTSTIPVSMIDRVEILTGGASSIYGADAVSGVVNFIMRDGSDFDGLEVRAQAGMTGKGDAEEAFLSAATGFTFAQGRGSSVIGAEYTHTEPVYASDRDFAGSGLYGFFPNTPELAAYVGADPSATNTYAPDWRYAVSSRLGVISLGEAGNNPGVAGYLAGDGSYPQIGSGMYPVLQVVDENGNLRAFNSGEVYVNTFYAVGGDGSSATPDVELILPKTDRIVLNANTQYEITPKLNFFMDTKFAFTDTFDSGQVNGFNSNIPIALDNPYLPTALQDQIADLQEDGITPSILVTRDTLDKAIRPLPNAERSTFRVVSGFEGELTDSINYEVSYNFGRTDATVTDSRTRIEDRFFAAVDAVEDPATGEIVCRSDLDPTAIPPVSSAPNPPQGFYTFNPGDGQCAPINILGENVIEGDGADFVFIPTQDRSVITQQVFSAVMSGDSSDLFSLPAGPVGWAGGYEYRKEESSFQPDPLNTAGRTFVAIAAGPTLPSEGSYDVSEAFVEAEVPLLSDLPLIEYLQAKGSVRVSDYSTIGSTTTWAVGGRWQPIEPLIIRGTHSKAVRSPNIGELFAPQNPSSIQNNQDPCNPNFINAGSQYRAENCLAFVDPGYDSTDYITSYVPGVSGGNPNLQEEEATTSTVGMVFEPSGSLEGVTAIVDYWDIEIEGAIDSLSAFNIAQACVDLPSIDNQFCEQIERDPTYGYMTGFVSGQINLGAIETSGVDWSVSYSFDLPPMGGRTNLGQLTLGTSGSHLLKDEEYQDPTDTTVFENRRGEFGRPEWISNFNATWVLDDLTLAWSGHYESSQLLPAVSNSDIESNPNFADPYETGDALVHDISADYIVNEGLKIYGGINNLADEKPYIGTLARPAGPRGRFFFLGVETKL